MTPEEMCEVFDTHIDLEFLETYLDKGIYVFYIEWNKYIGVSYETNEEGSVGYIFNLFLGDEYINVCGFYANIFDAVDAVTEAWNKLE